MPGPTQGVAAGAGDYFTEVIVTDNSIRDIVPGEPIPYADAVRRAIARSDD